jgi:hypothetical protein
MGHTSMTVPTTPVSGSTATLPDPPPLAADGQLGWGGLVFGDGTPYVIADDGLTGWEDLPDFDTADSPRTADHGSWPGARYAQSKVVTATVWIVPDSPGAAPAAISALRAATAFSDTEQWLTVRLHGETLAVAARMNQRVIPTDRQFGLFGTAKATLQWVATDPRRYVPAASSAATGLPQADSGISWNLTWPLTWGPAGVTGNLQLTNSGNAAAHPVLTFTGPCANPQVTNPVTGALLGYAISLGPADTLTVDTSVGQVVLNGTASRRYAAMPNSSPEELFTLPPGTTTLSFRPSSGSPPSAFAATWRSAYL